MQTMGPVLDMALHCLFQHTPNPLSFPQEFQAAFRERPQGASKSEGEVSEEDPFPTLLRTKQEKRTQRHVESCGSWLEGAGEVLLPSHHSLHSPCLTLPLCYSPNDTKKRGGKARGMDTRKGRAEKGGERTWEKKGRRARERMER